MFLYFQGAQALSMDCTTWYVRKRFSDVSHLTTDHIQQSIENYLVVDTRRKVNTLSIKDCIHRMQVNNFF